MKTMTAIIPREIILTDTPINLPGERVASLLATATHKGFTSEGKNGRHFAKRLGKFQNFEPPKSLLLAAFLLRPIK
jgi:hypothetical protein